MRYAAKREIVGFDLVVERELSELRHQAPMPAHGSFDYPLMREAIEPALLAIARRRRKDESEVHGVTFLEEAPFERQDQFIRRTDADKPRHTHRVTVAHDGHGFIGGDDLVL